MLISCHLDAQKPVLLEVSSAHQACICLIKNTVKQ